MNLLQILEKSQIPQDTKIISFDLFDTLLTRRVTPGTVLSIFYQKIADLSKKNKDDVRKTFDRLYNQHSSQSKASGADYEVLASEFLSEFSDVVGLARPMVDQIFIDIESALLFYRFPDIKRVLTDLKARGFKLIVTSDMYLGGSIIEEILSRSGLLDSFSKVYVSSDYGLLKREGGLFKHIIATEGIKPHQVLHLGDNQKADIEVPRTLGLNVLPVSRGDLDRQFLKDKFFRYLKNFNKLKTLSKLRALGITLEPKSYTEIGYSAFGLPLITFILHSLSECKSRGIRNLYFFSREGQHLLEIAETLSNYFSEFRNLFEFRYLFVSRLSTFWFDEAEFTERRYEYLIANGSKSLSDFVAPLGINHEFLENIAHDLGYEAADVDLNHKDFQSILRIYNHPVVSQAMARAASDAELTFEYFQQEGIVNAKKVAFFDVGWGGQIQNNIFRGLRKRGCDVKIFGFYVGINQMAQSRAVKGESEFYGTIATGDKLDNELEWLFQFPQGFEIACRAPHGTVLGYRRDKSSEIKPILKSPEDPTRIAEAKNDQTIQLIQEGVNKFLSCFLILAKHFQLDLAEMRKLSRVVVIKAHATPNKQTANLFREMINVVDVGSDKSHHLLEEFKYRSFFKGLRNSVWRSGYVAGSGSFLLLLVYLTARRIKQKGRAVGGSADGIADPGLCFDIYLDPTSSALGRFFIPWEAQSNLRGLFKLAFLRAINRIFGV